VERILNWQAELRTRSDARSVDSVCPLVALSCCTSAGLLLAVIGAVLAEDNA
jgi:hypothetical protein